MIWVRIIVSLSYNQRTNQIQAMAQMYNKSVQGIDYYTRNTWFTSLEDKNTTRLINSVCVTRLFLHKAFIIQMKNKGIIPNHNSLSFFSRNLVFSSRDII